MTVLTNPIVIKMLATAFIALAALAIFVWIIRTLRHRVTTPTGDVLRPSLENTTGFTLAAYQGVIQRYKEQEKELAGLREAERQRAVSMEKVSAAVLSQLSSGVLVFNSMGLLQQANPAARTIFGYSSPLNFHARDLFKGVSAVRNPDGTPAAGDAGPAPLLQALDRCIRQAEAAHRLEADYTTPAGDRRVLGITLSPVRDAQARGAACLVSDLTEFIAMGRQMRLRENLASLGEMSAGIAHEFKNSLATISGYAQMLSTNDHQPTARGFAQKIANEASNLTSVVTDFLKFARPGSLDAAGFSGEEKSVVDLRDLIEECARPYELDLDTQQWKGEARVPGDATALRQAFSNLLRNSAEAASNGTRVQVRVAAEMNGNCLQVSFSDNGCGIPPQDLEKIFIPFFTTKPTGTGLGLALVHRIVAQHNGTIAVSSNSQGTMFKLTLPAGSARPAGVS
jgi:signal transduction histidine kinase